MSQSSASSLAVLLTTAIICALGGYYIGSTFVSPASKTTTSSPVNSTSISQSSSIPVTSPAEYSSDSDSDDGSPQESDDYSTFANESGELKLVLLVRSDLGMTKGKIAAQCGHATLYCYKTAIKYVPSLVKRWESYGQAKIALKVDSEDDMILLQAQAQSLGLIAKVVRDAGRTQIAAGSATVLGIGPAPKKVIDQVTGHLKLL